MAKYRLTRGNIELSTSPINSEGMNSLQKPSNEKLSDGHAKSKENVSSADNTDESKGQTTSELSPAGKSDITADTTPNEPNSDNQSNLQQGNHSDNDSKKIEQKDANDNESDSEDDNEHEGKEPKQEKDNGQEDNSSKKSDTSKKEEQQSKQPETNENKDNAVKSNNDNPPKKPNSDAVKEKNNSSNNNVKKPDGKNSKGDKPSNVGRNQLGNKAQPKNKNKSPNINGTSSGSKAKGSPKYTPRGTGKAPSKKSLPRFKKAGQLASKGLKAGGGLLKKASSLFIKKGGALIAKGITGLLSLLSGKAILIILLAIGILALIILMIVASFMMFTGIFASDSSSRQETDSPTLCVGGSVVEENVTEIWDENTKGTTLHGQAPEMIQLAEEYNIDASIYLAIVAHETGWGSSYFAKAGNNFGGIKHFGQGTAIPGTDFRAFESPEEGLEAVADLLDRVYFSQGLTTIPDIQKVYAPTNDPIDTTGLNNNWVTNVTSISEQFGGEGMTCSVGSLDQDAVVFSDLDMAAPLPLDVLVNNMTFGIEGKHMSSYAGHDGVDFAFSGSQADIMAKASSTPVSAMIDGTVYFATSHYPNHSGPLSNPFSVGNLGNQIHIHPDADPKDTLEYAHMAPNHKVKVGDKVVKGQFLGNIGHNGKSTNYHSHIGWLKNSQWSPSSAMDWYTPMLKEINSGSYEEIEGEEESSEDENKEESKGSGGQANSDKLPQVEEKDGIYTIDGLVLVNEDYKLPKDYKADDDGLTDDTKIAFRKMNADYRKETETDSLVIASGFKTYEELEATYNVYKDKLSEAELNRNIDRPGVSEHQTGEAIDVLSSSEQQHGLVSSFGNTESGKWLQEHAHKYGFTLRYPNTKSHITGRAYEPWHLRYVGKDEALNLYETGLTIEEYYDINQE